jgi:hypothetical protein
MVLSARGTISRNCCLRIVRLIDASPFAAIARLLGSNRSPIESDRRQKMEDLPLARRGAEGAGIKFGGSCQDGQDCWTPNPGQSALS